ncbi:hypothetical protein VNI00_001426 [Paramarasmius palmivorus]|uniref:UTP23 sensor motif region domain-containing protein n=1 Tax=Paramarasmius palmivorus TaxID=297713 RepID=A0AAW0E2C5_9AGAR
MSFGFRQPYQVLVDSEICKEAIEHKIELVKQLGMKGQESAVALAKTFERRKCNHREAIPGDECLTSVVGDTNKHRYVIATQSQPLRSKLRTIPAVPIVHLTERSVMVLEPPSDTTIKAKQEAEEKSLHAPTSTISPSSTEHPTRKKKKGPKGPNPLSVKKKKAPEETTGKTKSAVRVKPLDDSNVHTGEKRKREDDAEGADEAGEGAASGGRKRKRKRKNKPVEATASEIS